MNEEDIGLLAAPDKPTVMSKLIVSVVMATVVHEFSGKDVPGLMSVSSIGGLRTVRLTRMVPAPAVHTPGMRDPRLFWYEPPLAVRWIMLEDMGEAARGNSPKVME